MGRSRVAGEFAICLFSSDSPIERFVGGSIRRCAGWAIQKRMGASACFSSRQKYACEDSADLRGGNGRPDGGGAFPESRRSAPGSTDRPAVPKPSGEGLGDEEPRLRRASKLLATFIKKRKRRSIREWTTNMAFSPQDFSKFYLGASRCGPRTCLSIIQRCRKTRRAERWRQR
jgi:hypothetical protein